MLIKEYQEMVISVMVCGLRFNMVIDVKIHHMQGSPISKVVICTLKRVNNNRKHTLN